MTQLLDQIDRKKLPAHVAVIMDGNGRWARQRGFIRARGHEKGVDAVRNTVEAAAALGIRFLTLYAFSTENWKRPKYEIDALMRILVNSLSREMPTLMKNGVRLEAIGDLESLPGKSRVQLQKSIDATAGNDGLTLILALSYSARWEMVRAMQTLARQVAAGLLQPEQIDQHTVSAALTTAGIPDPELLIRTSGENRISNFLLWQIAYAELYFTQTLWPDFTKDDFHRAILDFQSRERRFGQTGEQIRESEAKQTN